MISELWSDLRYRVRALFRRADVERELSAELQDHILRAAEKYQRAGMTPVDAARRARLEFGGVDRTMEEARDARGTAHLETFVRDVRYAARSLRKQPGFTLAVVSILGVGIGANSAVFTLVDGLLLKRLPVPRSEQLVIVGDPAAVHSAWTGSPETDFVSYPVFADIRDRNTVFSAVYANGSSDDLDVTIDDAESLEHPRGRFVSGGFFSVLQVPAYLGRTFTAAEDAAPGQDPVAVISYAYWQRRFAGDRSIVGRAIRVNHAPITIIGVTPPGFTGDIVGETMDIWIPMMMAPAIRPNRQLIDNRKASWLVIMGRLAPGATLAQAKNQIAAIEARSIRDHVSGRILSQFEDDLKSNPIRVQAGEFGFSEIRADYGSVILIAMAAVGLVVLVVCANVCSLMLTRAASRGREMTVRMALGAGRARLTRQLLTEACLLALFAATVGIFVAVGGSRLLLATAVVGDGPISLDTSPDLRVLAFTGAITIGCLSLFAIVPAMRATRVDVATSLRAHGRNLFGSRGRFGRVPVGRALVLAQMALSTLLLIGAGLLVRSVQQMLRVDLGLDRDRIVMVHVASSRTTYAGPRLALLRRTMVARARQVPGVDAASYSLEGLFSGGQSGGHVDVDGFVAQADSERQIRYDMVGPGFLRAIGATILRGRDFDAHDVDDSTYAGAINETMAKYYFAGRDPIGKTVVMDSTTYTIAAVVRDVQENRNVRAKPVRRLYFATFPTETRPQSFEMAIHVSRDPSAVIEPLRRALASVDRTIPLEITPLATRVRLSMAEDILVTKVTLCFGLVALGLAALGLYGVTSYSTAQRTAEFGLRTALGADPGAVTRLVVGEAVRLAIGGVVVGVPLGLAATPIIRNQIFGVRPVDAPSLTAAVVVLVLAALVASWLPARRAASISPLEALRSD